MPESSSDFSAWIGRTEIAEDQITAAPVAALTAVLDRDDPLPREGDVLPVLWHWLYFLPVHRQSELGTDGHARLGGFLPPVPFGRRMWAGGRLQFVAPLRIGERVLRESRIQDVVFKQGRSGRLCFVIVRHEIRNHAGVCVLEEHDIVYREESRATASETPAPINAAWQRTIAPDPVLLFRYSALTFNGHRIHYDRRYCEEVEAYPGLVVHGPLIATLLLDLLRRNMPRATVTQFDFRAVRPLFDVAPFLVCGKPEDGAVKLWACGTEGPLAMDARARVE